MFSIKLPKKLSTRISCCIRAPPEDYSRAEFVSKCGASLRGLIIISTIIFLSALGWYLNRGDGIVKMLGLPTPNHRIDL